MPREERSSPQPEVIFCTIDEREEFVHGSCEQAPDSQLLTVGTSDVLVPAVRRPAKPPMFKQLASGDEATVNKVDWHCEDMLRLEKDEIGSGNQL